MANSQSHNEFAAFQAGANLIASLMRPTNSAPPVLLLGAGASFSSGVPLAAESVNRLARRVYAEKAKGGAILPEQVKLSEWQDWLQSQPWFVRGPDALAENFPFVVENLLTPRAYRRKAIMDLMRPSTALGSGYRDLAKLWQRGLLSTVLTTNFDTCLLDALSEHRAHMPHVAEVNRAPGDTSQFGMFSQAQVVWLHGRAEQYTDCNLLEETEHLNAALVELLLPLLADSPLIVIGYRGAEHSVMRDLLGGGISRTGKFRNGVYWCTRPADAVHANVIEFQRAIGTNFRLVPIAGFDELFRDLTPLLEGEDRFLAPMGGHPRPVAASFDDQPFPGASLEELDWDLVLTTMRKYCEKLGRPAVTSETVLALLREQGLVVSTKGVDLPTAGCLLLFAKQPQIRFPQATITATIGGKKRIVFEGNLVRQRQQLRDWLAGEDVNPTLRVKGRTKHEDRPAYDDRALSELLTNLLVHRDYQKADGSTVDVQPGLSVTFENPGGLPDELISKVSMDDKGRFQPVANATALRNRSLCDVFFGIREMERAGTGLSDVLAISRESGGDAQFIHDQVGKRFVAQLRQPTASAGSGAIARDTRPTGVYVINALPFVSIPDRVSVVKLTSRLFARPEGMSLDGLGTFVATRDALWSFAPLERLLETIGPIADKAESAERDRSVIEATRDDANVLSWLLRRHFERHLEKFETIGLFREAASKRKRAFFHGQNGDGRTHRYDTPKRKGVERQVVKKRNQIVPWFENEGFSYEVIRIDDVWGIRIKPFYMFTGRDAQTPLPAFTRTAKATRRIKFDRNKSVEDDLTFWGRFLGEGKETINLGHEHVRDLLLQGSFLSVEVPESEPPLR
jgi:hypothetical protein